MRFFLVPPLKGGTHRVVDDIGHFGAGGFNFFTEQDRLYPSNPVKRGYVDEAVHWRYSSARDYEGIDGLIEIDKFLLVPPLLRCNS